MGVEEKEVTGGGGRGALFPGSVSNAVITYQ